MEVYDHIAQEFSNTRYALWKGVKEFLDKLPKHSIVADIGCGNGKYLSYRKDLFMLGIDACLSLVKIAKEKGEVLGANAINIPLHDKSVDAVICIAMMHHLKTKEEREKLIRELKRVSRGQVFITVWQVGVQKPTWEHIGDNNYMVPWNNKHLRFYHLFTEDEIKEFSNNYYEEFGNWHAILEP